MLTLHEEISVPRKVEDCFRYVADFRTTPEWDATAVRARKISDGPVGVGSVFEVDCKAGPTTLGLRYEILEYEPWHCVVLKGSHALFDVTDTIVFTATDDGTHIDYTAEFDYHLGLNAMAPRFEAGMRAMGARSLEGMRQALLDANPEPGAGDDTVCADRWLVPGVAMFSKWGYRRGRRRWAPVSRSMRGRHVVITGASAGLGLAAAIALADAEADLTLVIRNPGKADALRQTITAATGRDDIAIEFADLSLMRDVDALVARLLAADKAIDVLINNAGALFNEREVTDEGIEASVALLLLSPWRLTRGLRPLLADHAEPARVVNVVSGGMYTEKLVCDQLIMAPASYRGATAYARCKRALTVLTELWADAWAQDNIVVNAMHPGWADTPGVETSLPRFRALTRRILRSPEEGADTIVWLARATEADRVTGKLFLDREIRTPYLTERTRESAEERAALVPFLEDLERRIT